MTKDNRPISPHLTIYRPQITTVLSITHRFTGMALLAGFIAMTLWLLSAAYNPAFYAELHDWMISIVGKICLLGFIFAFYYHLANGIRHLFWDIGMGFSIPQLNRSGWLVIVFSLAMTAATWGFVTSSAGQ
jgi:succinate dehydrogenase / fumarate reductase, cytochrome b subunit